jgi:putative flippase GtrA
MKGFLENNGGQIVRFVFVGIAVALLYFFLIYALIVVFHFDYLYAVGCSYIIAVSMHFYLSRRITFRVSTGSVFSHGTRYIALMAFNYLANILIVYILVEWFRFSVSFGAISGIVATTISGYYVSRNWVFQRGANE